MKWTLSLFVALAFASVPAAALAGGCCPGDEAPAAEEGQAEASVHGGTLTESGDYRVETVLRKDGVRVYLFDDNDRPQKVAKLEGKATLTSPAGEKTEVKLAPARTRRGKVQEHLAAKLDLDFGEGGPRTIAVHLAGLGEEGEDSVSYEVAVKESAVVRYECPMHQTVAAEEPGLCPKCEMKLVRKVEQVTPANAATFTCPMHPEVVADAPGRCPKCRMNLVKAAGERKPPVRATAYSCPMHPAVKADAPGSCPKCGMALKPATGQSSGTD